MVDQWKEQAGETGEGIRNGHELRCYRVVFDGGPGARTEYISENGCSNLGRIG